MLLPPETADTFWVNLIGKGYPAPRPGFRWCTERLKIKPSSRFIENTANQYGEAILLLGARRAESSVRSASRDRREVLTKEGLTAHSELVSTLVYSPIQDWSNEDVWLFLNRIPNPWGQSNKDLMALYRGATENNECPIVVDTSTPSCGNSRFGCWVCTLVDQDKSMKAMIQNDVDKSWMLPLLELRNELDFRGDAQRQRDIERREFRRLRGAPTLNRTGDTLVPGPYTQEARIGWLTRLLEAQTAIRRNPAAPDHVRKIELISRKELEDIRRIWVEEKHEIEDVLPALFRTITGENSWKTGTRLPCWMRMRCHCSKTPPVRTDCITRRCATCCTLNISTDAAERPSQSGGCSRSWRLRSAADSLLTRPTRSSGRSGTPRQLSAVQIRIRSTRAIFS